MLELSSLDLDDIAIALAEQIDYERRWLINPDSGEVVHWTADGGIDGKTPVDRDELDLLCIDPLPSYVWYQDMVDFAEMVSDERAGRRLAWALDGRGAFRRFKDELHEEYPHLLPARLVLLQGRPRPAQGRGMAGRQLPHRRRCSPALHDRPPRPRCALSRAANGVVVVGGTPFRRVKVGDALVQHIPPWTRCWSGSYIRTHRYRPAAETSS